MIRYTLVPDGLLTAEEYILELINDEVKHYKINIAGYKTTDNKLFKVAAHKKSIFKGPLPYNSMAGGVSWELHLSYILKKIRTKQNLPELLEIGT